MASFAEMIFENASKDIATPGPLASAGQGLMQGVQLAEQVNQIHDRKAQLELQRQQMQDKKLDMFVNAVEKGQQYTGKAQSNYYNKFLPQYRNTLGLQEQFSDDALSFVTSTPENVGRLNTLFIMRQNGEITGAELMEKMSDPVYMAGVTPTEKDFQHAREVDKVAVENRQEVNKQQTEIESTGYKAEQKDIADRWINYEAGGGAGGFEKSVAAYEKAIAMLSKGPNGEPPEVELGTLAKKLPYGSDENVLARLDPKAKALMDTIRGGLNIRAISGDPNPAKTQIDDLMSRVIDGRLDNAKNIAKLKADLQLNKTNHANLLKSFQRAGKPVESAPPPFDIDAMKAKIATIKDPVVLERSLNSAAARLKIPVNKLKKQLGIK